MTVFDQIQTVDFHSRNLSSFHIRSLQSFTYPTALQKITEAPHRHNFQEIIWIKSGSGKQTIDGQMLKIQAQTFYLVARGQVHQFIQGNNIDGYVLRYTDDFLPEQSRPGSRYFQNAIFNNLNSVHTVHVEKAIVSEFEQLLAQMTFEHGGSEKFGKQVILGHMLQILLVKLERLLKTASANDEHSNDDRHDVYREFITALEQHYKNHHKVGYYAKLLGIPARQLSGITKRLVGKTSKQVIEERLVLEAKRYLKFSDQSVKEIAYSLGYEDPSYFSKVFRKLAGVAAHEYKD